MLMHINTSDLKSDKINKENKKLIIYITDLKSE